MQLTKEVKQVVNSLKDYGIYQHEYMFPWMDSFLFYRKSPNQLDYYTSTPEYQDNAVAFKNFFKSAGEQYDNPPLYDIVYAKQTQKGLHCPCKEPVIIWSIKGDIKLIIADETMKLLHTVAIYDYDLFNFKNRKMKLNTIKEGEMFVVGNRFAHCLHMEEGQEVLYARYR